MKQGLPCVIILLLCLLGTVYAEVDRSVSTSLDVKGMVDLTYQSQYLWRGFSWFGSQPGMQFTASAELPDIGLGILVSGHHPLGSDYKIRRRWDGSAYYHNTLAADEIYALDFRLGWVYYNHSVLPQKANDLMEMHLILACPHITHVEGLIPSYIVARLWPANGGDSVINRAGYGRGWLHVLNLDYIYWIPGLTSNTQEQIVKIHTEITYNDGVNPVDGTPITPSWSHAVFGVSTDFDLGGGLTFTPSVFFQSSMEQTVNERDRLWTTLGLRYRF